MSSKEYIEREKTLSFPFANGKYDHANANEHFINGCETYKEWLIDIPAADVVPVVRCKDCKHGTRLVCDLAGNEGIECRHGNIYHRLDWFCADGVKMDKEDTNGSQTD